MADALDSKSSGLRAVWVQLPPPVLKMVYANPSEDFSKGIW